jgi:hypothetical protein
VQYVLDVAVGASEVLQSARSSLWADIAQRMTHAIAACVLPAATALLGASDAPDQRDCDRV